ncbi:MAG: lysine--tRNA ligase [Mycoplasmataceae bacterium]|nr:lysine--tRNA ligase [Mycoplasmataceae bacterium]
MKREFSEQEIARREKLEKLKELGIDPFGDGYFKPSHYSKDIKEKFINIKSKEDLENNPEAQKELFKLTGRVMLKRGQGKAGFMQIKDSYGSIQIYIKKAEISELDFNVWSLADIGDYIGVEGNLMITGTGELTIRVTSYKLLTKSLRPLPEKFHGLTDIEEKYRRRYVDLIVNDEAREVFRNRTKMIRTIQRILDERGYIEVETPMLHGTLGGAAAKPFETHHNSLGQDLYLRIATELHLKRLIVGGFDKVYEIGRIFRNEGISTKHNPEFTSIELYEANGNLDTMIEVTEALVKGVVKSVRGTEVIDYQEHKLDFSKPFKKISMIELIKKEKGIDFKKVKSFEEAKKIAKKHNVKISDHMYGIGHIITEFFEEFCEDKLIQPTFVTGYPVEVSPLAKRNKDDNTMTDRFELYIAGREYANAFSELNDPDDQYNRFLSQLKEKELGSEEASEMDIDYVQALEYGMPPTGGMGLGIDRLAMLVNNKSSIRDVLLFPQLKRK